MNCKSEEAFIFISWFCFVLQELLDGSDISWENVASFIPCSLVDTDPMVIATHFQCDNKSVAYRNETSS